MNALAPEHLVDLRRSGLSDATIHALQFRAVRPHEIKLRGVTSAYEIPYFNLDGSVNCFKRRRLFPPVTRPDGGTQKYFQATGTPPSLYLPPLFQWQTVATDARSAVFIVEGEKKAAAACEHGLFAMGVGGVWNWRQRLESGERLLLPLLDQFVWQGRSVVLIPDNDAWRTDKLLTVLSGFFALGQELISRGATVRLLQLPERSGAKVGLDDWLVAVGADWEHQWPHLERRSLDDPRLAPVAAWWQGWREKQATQTALQAHDTQDLELTETAGLHTVICAKHSVRFTFDRLADVRGGVSAELSVYRGLVELLSGVDVGLKSGTSQTKLAGSLKVGAVNIPWKLLLQKSCALVLRRHREGEPLRILTIETPIESLTYQVNPFVFSRKPTVLFGDGGLGKSSLALLCAMLVSTGETVAGVSALSGKALYLDYEDSYDVHVRRMRAIAACHPILARADVQYQACNEPLTTLAHTLLRRIQAEGITFLVLDSLAAATGGDASAESATKVFRAIRTIGVGALVLAHVPKSPVEGQDPSIYGSVFHKNFSRSTWELRKEQEVGADVSILGLFNRKSNLSRLHLPFGLKVTQNADNTLMQYEPFDLNKAAELAKALPAPAQIRNFLEDGTPRTAKQIAEGTGLKLATVTSALSRDKGRKWQMIGGAGQDTLWCVLGSK
jgi:hypothetical protein